MAGLGFKDFQVGEVLTSADVDGYLMQQTVMRFADAAARGSALGTAVGTAVALAEGMVAYLDDADRTEFYNGTDWRAVSRVLQVQQAYVTADQTVTATSYTDLTGSTVTVTPASASSKFLLLFTTAVEPQAVVGVDARFDRGGTSIGEAFSLIKPATYDGFMSMNYLDAPATTSSVTYKMEVQVASSSAIFRSSSLTVIEVAS